MYFRWSHRTKTRMSKLPSEPTQWYFAACCILSRMLHAAYNDVTSQKFLQTSVHVRTSFHFESSFPIQTLMSLQIKVFFTRKVVWMGRIWPQIQNICTILFIDTWLNRVQCFPFTPSYGPVSHFGLSWPEGSDLVLNVDPDNTLARKPAVNSDQCNKTHGFAHILRLRSNWIAHQ